MARRTANLRPMPSVSGADLPFLSVAEQARLFRAKKLSPAELVRVYLERIERLNPKLNVFLTVMGETALREARLAEREIARGEWRGPLHGVAVALKDNIWTRGVRTTAGSMILADFVPKVDAMLVTRLREVGAVILGKTHLHEFAYGVTSNNAHYGPARNPYETDRVPGGSSGGSAIAVAAGLCAAAVGTDTGGSIRIPAALCGVVGFKPSFGAVSVEGIVPLCLSLDHAGPITRTVEDAALLFEAMRSGKGLKMRKGGSKSLPARGARVGWPIDYFLERVAPDVRSAVDTARRVLEGCGARFVPVKLSRLEAANRATLPVALAEAYQYHRAMGYFPQRAAEYSDEVRRRFEMGAAVTAGDYLDAKEVFRAATEEFERCAATVDAIMAPTTPIAAPAIGQDRVAIDGVEEDVRGTLLRFCRPANMWGAPAISIPCGATAEGLPIGLQLIGFRGDEARLLALARMYEQATEWRARRPKLA